MVILAHAGHWAAQVLYVVPLIVLAAVMGRQWVRDRLRATTRPGRRRS